MKAPHRFLSPERLEELCAVKRQAARALDKMDNMSIFIIQVLLGTHRSPTMSSLLFALHKDGDKAKIIFHKSPPKLLRETRMWLPITEPGVIWQQTVKDAIEDNARSFSLKESISPEDLLVTIEVGKLVAIKGLVREHGSFLVRF